MRFLVLVLFFLTSCSVKKHSILDDGTTKKFLTGQFEYIQDDNFIKVDSNLTVQDVYLQKEVYEKYLAMYSHAQKNGINLVLLSGTRNFDHQVKVWNRKWDESISVRDATKNNLEFVAMPMTSRHHWGTDLDFWDISNNLEKGINEYKWLTENADKYGFYQVYTSKEREPSRTGYNEEKWHWSYVALSCEYLKEYNKYVKIKDIKGFRGDEFTKEIDIIQNYVNGVTHKAKNC
jgi:D-alanyl-D-alanine carboxypeptidase